MIMNRRIFASTLAAGAAAAFLPRGADARIIVPARNVVLVHGLFADGSC